MLKAIQVGFGLAIGVGVAYLALIAAIILLPFGVAYAITYPGVAVEVGVILGVIRFGWWLFERGDSVDR